ncbi:MAG: Gfo/Idh/MocA family oxidoreductase [Candidatus Nitrosocaldaceae archaeon]
MRSIEVGLHLYISMNIAVIGTGGWGKNHVRVLNELNVLKAVCDLDYSRAESLAAKYNVKAYSSLTDMLNNEQLDGVIISTPTSTHYSIAEKVLEKRIAILLEKPFTKTIKEGEELIRRAKKNNTLLTAGYIERFNPVVKYAKSIIDNKSYGDVLLLEFHRENRRPIRITDVGIILDTAVHDIDTALYLLNEMPNVVFARSGKKSGEYEEYSLLILGFKNKNAFIVSNWITPKKMRNFDIICSEGIVSGNFITQEIRIESDDNTIIPRIEYQEPLMLELQNFINAIENKAEPLIKAEEALKTLKIADAALLSSQHGSQIYIGEYQ